MLVNVKRGTHIAWKVLPGCTVEESAEQCFRAQSTADWSAIYAQLSLEHAVCYLNNHYDRGNVSAHLVAITAARDIQCTIFDDERMSASDLTPFEKAVLLRKYLNENVCGVPLKDDESLMQSVGEQLGIFVVIPDSDGLLECVVPHGIMNFDYFSFTSYVRFGRDALNPCLTRSVLMTPRPGQAQNEAGPLALTKDERSDPALLGRRLARCTYGDLSVHCSWVAGHVGSRSAGVLPSQYPPTAESKASIDDVMPLLSDIVMTPVARVRDSDKSSDDGVIRRVTMSEAAEIASRDSLSVKTLPRRPSEYQSMSFSGSLPANNTIIASDGKEYHVAPLCLPPPAEIAKFLREMKIKREQGYFRMTPPSKAAVPTPGRPRYPQLPKEWMQSSKLSPDRKSIFKRSNSGVERKSVDWSVGEDPAEGMPVVIDEDSIKAENISQYLDDDPPVEARPTSLWQQIRDELIGENIEDFERSDDLNSQEDADINSTTNIENFIGVPRRLEGFVWFGVLVCLEAFLYAISIMLIRFVVAVYCVVRSCFSSDRRVYRTHLFDMCRGGLVIVGCCVLMMFHMSRFYHIIRTQSTIKLYSFTSMLEVFDRLLGSFGQDAMQYLHAAIKKDLTDGLGSQFWNISFAFLIVSVYVAIHSSLYFITIATLTVAVNTADKALMTVLIINNFAEIKAFAFKKFDKEALFVMSCGDITERFQIVLFFGLISALGVLHSDASLITENLWMNSKVLAYMVGAEMLADWIKHAFIAKFNKIGPGIYRKYARILRADYVNYRKERVILDYTHFISRRVGLAQIPLACIFFRFVVLAIHTPAVMLWQEEQTRTGIVLWCIFAFLTIIAAKMLLSCVLVAFINSRYERDLLDSKADGLDKDVVDRLSNIEKYTILRTDSSIFSVLNKDENGANAPDG